MSSARVLVIADAQENIAALSTLLSQVGYTVILAEEGVAPPPVDMVVAEVTRIMFSPFISLEAQRRLGCNAPALVIAPRVNEQMAGKMFALDIRDFVVKPIEDADLLERIKHFGTALHQTQMESNASQVLAQTQATLARRMEEMTMLSRIGRAISAQSDLDQMLAHIVDAGVFLTHAQEGAIFLTEDSGASLILRAEKGLGAKQSEIIRRPSQDSDAMEVLRSGQPIRKSGDTEHKVKTGYLVRGLINVPIVTGNTVVGVVAVYNHGDRSFDEIDEAILTNLADYAALVIDKIRSIEQVESKIDNAREASREIILHAQTLMAPIEGIESLVETLLHGDFGPLTEQQNTAIHRIQNATIRLNEIAGFINDAVASTEMSQAGPK